jgi:hypothetical protein
MLMVQSLPFLFPVPIRPFILALLALAVVLVGAPVALAQDTSSSEAAPAPEAVLPAIGVSVRDRVIASLPMPTRTVSRMIPTPRFATAGRGSRARRANA